MSRLAAYVRDQRVQPVTRRNYALNPRPADITGWEVYGGLQPGETLTYESGPGPEGRNGFVRFTSAGNVVESVLMRYIRPVAEPTGPFAPASAMMRVSMFVRSSSYVPAFGNFYVSGVDDTATADGVDLDLEADVWSRFVVAADISTVGGVEFVEVDLVAQRATLPLDATLDIAGVVIEANDFLPPEDTYFDGSSPGASWDGTPDASESTLGLWSVVV